MIWMIHSRLQTDTTAVNPLNYVTHWLRPHRHTHTGVYPGGDSNLPLLIPPYPFPFFPFPYKCEIILNRWVTPNSQQIKHWTQPKQPCCPSKQSQQSEYGRLAWLYQTLQPVYQLTLYSTATQWLDLIEGGDVDRLHEVLKLGDLFLQKVSPNLHRPHHHYY